LEPSTDRIVGRWKQHKSPFVIGDKMGVSTTIKVGDLVRPRKDSVLDSGLDEIGLVLEVDYVRVLRAHQPHLHAFVEWYGKQGTRFWEEACDLELCRVD
jgi:hypothetical protein